MNRLKEELRKRGLSFAGKKGELQDRLKEAVVNNVPVALPRTVFTADPEDAEPDPAADPWQRKDCGGDRNWLATEAPVIPAFLCVPGSYDAAPSKKSMPELQG